MSRRSQRRAERWFFPLAAAYGALFVPASVHALTAGPGWFSALASASGHAQELLFGYGLAVVAGFLVGRVGTGLLVGLAGLWLLARLGFWVAPDTGVSGVLNAAFAAALAATVAPKFLRGAKKLRNQAFAPLLLVLCATAVVYQIAPLLHALPLQRLAVDGAVAGFAALMLFMGGRIIAPAAAGAIQKQGGHLEARVQPTLEATLLLLLAGGLVLAWIPEPLIRQAAGLLLVLAALVAAVRLVRWRLWACTSRPDLLSLGLGYAWAVAGTGLLGLQWFTGLGGPADVLHALTVGAMGTLSATVMLRVASQGMTPLEPGLWSCLIIGGGMTTAGVLRLTGGASTGALLAASALWSVVLAWVFLNLLRLAATRSSGR